MNMSRTWMLTILAVAGVAGVAIVGCESTKSTSDSISLSPSSVTLTNATAVTFTATLGNTNVAAVLPLVWTVNDESLGHIEGRGMTAVYTSTGKRGSNNIKVRDQADGEGIAVVNQEVPSSPDVAIVNNTIIVTPAAARYGAAIVGTVVFTATLNSSSVLPLKWSVSDESLGKLVSASGNTAKIEFYDKPGTNTVVVQDSGLGLGSATIFHD